MSTTLREFVAATNAVRDATIKLEEKVSPIGNFTKPEYAQVGLTEAKAREKHDAVTAIVRFDSTTQTIIDGRTAGFCKVNGTHRLSRSLGGRVTRDK